MNRTILLILSLSVAAAPANASDAPVSASTPTKAVTVAAASPTTKRNDWNAVSPGSAAARAEREERCSAVC